MTEETKYPEHEALKAIKDESQAIGAFLDWLQNERSVFLADYSVYDTMLMPVHNSVEDWLAEYFNIDRKALEREKRAMLDEFRSSSLAAEDPGDPPLGPSPAPEGEREVQR